MYQDGYPRSSHSYVVIAASPRDPVGPELADELEHIGWRVALTSDIELYAGRMSACIVVLRRPTADSPAVRAIFAARPRQLVPVLAEPMQAPPGPWTSPPITLARGVQAVADEIATVLRGWGAPATRPLYPSGPAQPSIPLYPVAQPPGYPASPFAPAAAQSRSRARPWIVASVILAVVLALGTVGGLLAVQRISRTAAHLSPTATATIPERFTAYTDANGLYRLTVPADWSTKTEDKIILFASPLSDAVFEVTSVNLAMSEDEIRVNEEEFFKALAGSGGGSGTYTNLQGPTKVTLNGTSWTREEADAPLKDGKGHAVVFIAVHRGNTFVLADIAYKAVYASVDAADFQPMLNSFEFLK